MIVFLDKDYKCHLENDGTMRAFDIPGLNGKCKEYIEGYRFIPNEEQWTDEKGFIFKGEMITPWKDFSQLKAIQKAVDRIQDKVDAEQMELLDIIEYLIMEG